jgi:WD40 repeat protein
MKTSHETLTGVVCIIALVAAAVWYAGEPELQHWTKSQFNAMRMNPTELRQVFVSRVDWSADGSKLLTLSHGEISAHGSLALHDATRNIGRTAIDAGDEPVTCAALAPDGQHVLVGTAHGHLWWIDPESGDMVLLVELPPLTSITALAIADGGDLVAAATNRGSIFVCDPADRGSRSFAADRESSVTDLRFSRNQQQLASAQNDGSIAVWDVASGSLRHELAKHDKGATAAAFLSDGERILSAGLDDTIRVWEIAGGRELWRGEFGLGGVKTLDVSRDGTTAVWGGFSGKIVVWDLTRGRKNFEITTSATIIYRLKMSPDAKSLAVAGKEGTVRVYDVQSGVELRGFEM